MSFYLLRSASICLLRLTRLKDPVRAVTKRGLTATKYRACLHSASVSENIDGSGLGKDTPVIRKAVGDEEALTVTWGDGSTTHYPYVWLRDNCQCPDCFHPVSKSRTFLMRFLDLSVKPADIQLESDSSIVSIRWSDGHHSSFPADWILARSFREAEQLARDRIIRRPPILWGTEYDLNATAADFTQLMTDDDTLLRFLVNWQTYGLVKITGAGNQLGQVRRLLEKIGFVRRTHYGETFAVKSKKDPSNVAYTSDALQLHTDLPYYHYKPGAQVIHFVIQFPGEGGETQLADAFQVARQLRQMDPDSYQLLTNTRVSWTDVAEEDGRKYEKHNLSPVICTNLWGEVTRINFSQPQRDSFFRVPVDTVKPWYSAMKLFHDLLYHPSNCIHTKMPSGTIVVFDNLRIVHGRTAYESTEDGDRHVEGAYIDWDELHSAVNVLSAARSRSPVS